MSAISQIRGKQLPIICIASFLMACTDNSYKGVTGQDVIYPEETLPVMISVGNPASATRGSGTIDPNSNSWHDANIYVYSFKRDMSTDFRALSISDKATCLVDASANNNSALGKKAVINKNETYISWVDNQENVLYPANNLPYDFFGYFIDDLVVSEQDVVRSKDGIQLKVTIDGTQDLMSARAVLTEEQYNRKEFDNEEKANIKEWYYSLYTATRNIHPIMIFKHHLSRFIFQIYPATNKANDVVIDEVKVVSKREGWFTVAHAITGNMGVDFSADVPYEDVLLREEKGEPLLSDTYRTNYQGDFSEPLYDRPFVRVGESLMLPPGEVNYSCYVRLKQTIGGVAHTFDSEVPLSNSGDTFKAGTQYIVKLAIYGLQDIGVAVSPTPWIDGGDITIDPDEEFGKE